MPPCFNIDSKHYIEMKQTKYISERVLLVFAVVNSLENTWSKNSQGRFKGLLHAKQHIKQILTYGFIVLD
jgi:heptaprenylglyceryl phosphate synthase